MILSSSKCRLSKGFELCSGCMCIDDDDGDDVDDDSVDADEMVTTLKTMTSMAMTKVLTMTTTITEDNDHGVCLKVISSGKAIANTI